MTKETISRTQLSFLHVATSFLSPSTGHVKEKATRRSQKISSVTKELQHKLIFCYHLLVPQDKEKEIVTLWNQGLSFNKHLRHTDCWPHKVPSGKPTIVTVPIIIS